MCTVNILKEHQNSKSTIHAINMNYMYIPGGDVECFIGNGIMGQIVIRFRVRHSVILPGTYRVDGVDVAPEMERK